jgi:cyclase
LLIDALASRKDADALRHFIEDELKKKVRFILSTHFMSDHMAVLKSFPRAQIIAHENYRQTFVSQRSLTDEEVWFFVEPTITFSDRMKIKWGRLTLDIFHNPSHTMSTIVIDISEADLLLVGDALIKIPSAINLGTNQATA